MTAAQPAGRFGALELNDDCSVISFSREAKRRRALGSMEDFLCVSPRYLTIYPMMMPKYLVETMGRIVDDAQCKAYQHEGFFMPMDTLRDKTILHSLWVEGNAPWKVW